MAKNQSTPSVTDRAKDKATQIRETLGDQAGHVAKATRVKSSAFADQAKHKAQEFAETARSAAQKDGGKRSESARARRLGGAAVASVSAVVALGWIRKRRRQRAKGWFGRLRRHR